MPIDTEIVDSRRSAATTTVRSLRVGTWFIHRNHLYLLAGENICISAKTGLRVSWNEEWEADPVSVRIEILENLS